MAKKKIARKKATKPAKAAKPAVADAPEESTDAIDHLTPVPRRAEWFAPAMRDVAEFFGLTDSFVRRSKWLTDSAKDPDNGYYIPELVQRRHQQALRSPQASEGSSTLSSRKVQVLDEDYRKKKFENDIREGKLVHIDRVTRQIVEWAIRFRTPLMQLPRQVSNRVPGSQKAAVKKEVESEVRIALDRVLKFRFKGQTADDMILEEADRIRKRRRAGRGKSKKKTA